MSTGRPLNSPTSDTVWLRVKARRPLQQPRQQITITTVRSKQSKSKPMRQMTPMVAKTITGGKSSSVSLSTLSSSVAKNLHIWHRAFLTHILFYKKR